MLLLSKDENSPPSAGEGSEMECATEQRCLWHPCTDSAYKGFKEAHMCSSQTEESPDGAAGQGEAEQTDSMRNLIVCVVFSTFGVIHKPSQLSLSLLMMII